MIATAPGVRATRLSRSLALPASSGGCACPEKKSLAQ